MKGRGRAVVPQNTNSNRNFSCKVKGTVSTTGLPLLWSSVSLMVSVLVELNFKLQVELSFLCQGFWRQKTRAIFRFLFWFPQGLNTIVEPRGKLMWCNDCSLHYPSFSRRLMLLVIINNYNINDKQWCCSFCSRSRTMEFWVFPSPWSITFYNT